RREAIHPPSPGGVGSRREGDGRPCPGRLHRVRGRSLSAGAVRSTSGPRRASRDGLEGLAGQLVLGRGRLRPGTGGTLLGAVAGRANSATRYGRPSSNGPGRPSMIASTSSPVTVLFVSSAWATARIDERFSERRSWVRFNRSASLASIR